MTEDAKSNRLLLVDVGAFAATIASAGFVVAVTFAGVVPAVFLVVGMMLGAAVSGVARWWLRKKVGS